MGGRVSVRAVVGSIAVALLCASSASAAAPANTSAPTITGTAEVGRTLQAGPGTWSGSPASFAYQWKLCAGGGGTCTNLPEETDPEYVLTPSDQNDKIVVEVTATNADGSASAPSPQTPFIVANPGTIPAAGTPSIVVNPPGDTAAPHVGDTMHAQTPTFSPAATTTSFKWRRCSIAGDNCSTISGATSQDYTLVGADAGRTIVLRVTGSNSSGSRVVTSTASALVTWTDRDGDGVTGETDCNDADPAIRPGAVDTPGNGLDEDCSGADATQPPSGGDPPPTGTPVGITPPPPGPAADTVAATLTRIIITTRIAYRLSEAARVRLKIERCARTKGKRCTRWRKIGRTLTQNGKAGANAVKLPRLKAGRYRVTITTVDAAGNKSRALRKAFRVRRA